MQPAGQDPEARLVPGTVTVPLCSQTNASPFWIMLLLVWGRLDHGIIRIACGIDASGPEPAPIAAVRDRVRRFHWPSAARIVGTLGATHHRAFVIWAHHKCQLVRTC